MCQPKKLDRDTLDTVYVVAGPNVTGYYLVNQMSGYPLPYYTIRSSIISQ